MSDSGFIVGKLKEFGDVMPHFFFFFLGGGVLLWLRAGCDLPQLSSSSPISHSSM